MKKLCDVFNNEYHSRIKAMTWEEFSVDLVRRQRKELEEYHKRKSELNGRDNEKETEELSKKC
jgi:hypothetical protein